MKRAKGWRCREHQDAERRRRPTSSLELVAAIEPLAFERLPGPCGWPRCPLMVEAQSLQDRIEAIVHLADAGRFEALGADGLTPSAAFLAIEVLAESIISDENTARLPGEEYVKWAPIEPDEEEPERGRSRVAKPSRVPRPVPATTPDRPSDKIQ